jgi:hypothetical protein
VSLPVLAVVFALEMKCVLLNLCVAERFKDSSSVGTQEIVRHVGVEVQVVCVVQEVSEEKKVKPNIHLLFLWQTSRCDILLFEAKNTRNSLKWHKTFDLTIYFC